MLRSAIALAVIATLGFGSAAVAGPNLVSNGNFATGDTSGFALGGSYSTNPITVIATGPGSAGAYGESIPVDNATSASPDQAVPFAAYFVDDHAVNQSLSQTVMLAVGTYDVGFDYYIPFNGFANINNASFSAAVAGVTLANFLIGSGTPGVWTNVKGTIDITIAGSYAVSFLFNSFGDPAKDVVIDRVFLVADTAIPEPTSLLVMGSALAALAFMRRRA